MARGFGVAAGLDPEVARPLAARCAELGYDSVWSNDHPGAKGLETLAQFAAAAPELDLGVAVIALDRQSPSEIAADVERLGLDRSKLWLGVGAGFSKKPLTRMREILPELREALPGARLVLAAMGPKMCALAGAEFDGAFFNWMTPEFAARARSQVEAGAKDADRECPRYSATSAPPSVPTPPSASPRRSPSTATCTPAIATISTAWRSPRATVGVAAPTPESPEGPRRLHRSGHDGGRRGLRRPTSMRWERRRCRGSVRRDGNTLPKSSRNHA